MHFVQTPSGRPHMRDTTRVNPLERDRQRAIYEYLLLVHPKGCWWRSEPAGAYLHGRPQKRNDIVTAGVPDLMGMLDGRCIGIEVKRERNRAGAPMALQPSQIEFQRRFEAAGGRYLVATDIDDVDEALRSF